MLKMFIMARALLHAAQYEEARLTAKALLGEVEVVDFEIDVYGTVILTETYNPSNDRYTTTSLGKEAEAMQIFINGDPYWGFESCEKGYITTKIGNVCKYDTWKKIIVVELNK